MDIGLTIPQAGNLADRHAVTTVATAAEAAGYRSLWALDRLLAPVEPRSPYPGSPDGSLPPPMRRVLDPIGVLTLTAAVTERIRIGTSVLVAPWYPPVVLARSLTTLDHLSGGRLTVGLGIGWSQDEYEAVGVPIDERALRLEEALDVLEQAWTAPVVSAEGRFGRIAPCTIEPKPLQRPRPPVLLAAFTPAGLDRIARRGEGWLPVGLPHHVLAMLWAGLRDQAAGHGRDPEQLRLVVRGNVHVTPGPLDGDRPVFVGSLEQVAEDLHATAAVGAHELILDLSANATTASEQLELAAAVTGAAGVIAAGVDLDRSPAAARG